MKILRDEGLLISVSSVQAQIFYGHAQLMHLVAAMAAGEGLPRSDELVYSPQVEDVAGNVTLNIGCLRNDYGMPDLLQFWSVADNVRFSCTMIAALTAEKLMAEAST